MWTDAFSGGSIFVVVVVVFFLRARGIGTNGASARIFKKHFNFDDFTKNKGL